MFAIPTLRQMPGAVGHFFFNPAVKAGEELAGGNATDDLKRQGGGKTRLAGVMLVVGNSGTALATHQKGHFSLGEAAALAVGN